VSGRGSAHNHGIVAGLPPHTRVDDPALGDERQRLGLRGQVRAYDVVFGHDREAAELVASLIRTRLDAPSADAG
jgi:hypothetical protein